ncbi:Uncharacterised protein [Chryseobacterium indologenes]|nr:Uncharacterised protein [Chryseobacterium indologenes]
MLKPTVLNICISILLKYLIFYIILMMINNEFKLLQINNIKNGTDLFYYLWIVLFFPIVDMILFAAPLYFGLKARKALSFIMIIVITFLIEYFIYAYFTSQKLVNRDALFKVIISLIILFIFFYKTIRSKFTGS